MPSRNSYAEIITDLQELVEAANRETDLQPSIETERLALVEALAEIQELRGRQVELKALRQEITQKLKAAIGRGKDAGIVVRSVVKAKIGPRSERLVHFKVTPIRKRTRKPAEKPTDGEGPEVKTAPESSPSAKSAA